MSTAELEERLRHRDKQIEEQAARIQYSIFGQPDSTELPPVDGVRNGEWRTRILIPMAYLVYWTVVSIDKPGTVRVMHRRRSVGKPVAPDGQSRVDGRFDCPFGARFDRVSQSDIPLERSQW